MMTTDPQRSDATRALLVDYVAEHPAKPRRRLWGTALVLTGALVGAGVSTAAFAATSLLSPDTEQLTATASEPAAIPAPDGVTPGAPAIVTLNEPHSTTVEGSVQVSLTDRPAAATHVRATITPAIPTNAPVTTGGHVSFGTDAAGNNPITSWTVDDVESGRDLSTWFDFPLDDDTSALYVTATGSPVVVTLQYQTQIPTRFGVNAKGETFGVGFQGVFQPDLIAVMATNGEEGYAYRTDLEEADGTAAAREFTSPEDALAWQEANEGVRHVIPVYESDGMTNVGEYVVG